MDYNRIQRGGDIPHYGLRMSAPDRAKGRTESYCKLIDGGGGMEMIESRVKVHMHENKGLSS